MEQELDKQYNNNADYIKPYMWKKGQSGNIMGRPKGKTMKEYARQYLERMTDEERDEWLEGLDKEIVWKMSEGNPESKDTVTLVTPNIQIAEDIANKYAITPSPKEDSKE